MSKAGKRLIAAAKEAVAVARGEQPAARITIMGHAYVPEGDVAAAIAVVQKHLRDEYIVNRCRKSPCIGCASCEAVDLERRLQGVKNAVDWYETTPAHEGEQG